MARIKKTYDYLIELKNRGYNRSNELLELYNKWKRDTDIRSLSDFLSIIWKEKDNIKPKYLGENSYNNFRGVAFEEFCFDLVNKIFEEVGAKDEIKPFWNEKVLTDEFYIFEDGRFKIHPKYKRVDIVIGKKEGNSVHPIVIISCKIWQSTNWLDEDRAVFDNIRNRYPYVLGYSLCMNLN
ncbi:MAG TPA: hypothetical protein ENG60_02145, partial [Thermoplasmatales archaeon]|nr:hypothetical protein [Thermoplasmatales archaeon]HEX17202.1 hypothetical protein [Thermoplasmatales archaeon]